MAEGGYDIPEDEAGGRLIVDLAALKANWLELARHARLATCAAVVKADAYGIGIEHAVPALLAAGCKTFFVAIPAEARRLRNVAPGATLYVLGGLAREAMPIMRELDARPVLGSLPEIEAWAGFCRRMQERLPGAIHIDTGMNRLGLSAGDVAALAARSEVLDAFEMTLVMSHLACADTPEHPLNARQVEQFDALRKLLPPAPASLSNSAGTLLGSPYRFDLVRPGIALYGGRALADRPNPMQPVVTVQARIIQIRHAKAGETVGYGAQETLRRDSRLAILSAGYADGYFRTAGSSDARRGASAFIGVHEAPLVGRVSMDLIAADVTEVPEDQIVPGGFAQLLGDRFGVDDLAERAGTIGYEVLTNLGRRYHRIYVGGDI